MSLVSVLEAPVRVAEAIKSASRATGADFGYLLKTAARESNFNFGAKAKTSSAAGLFQFIENTWLETVKDVGDRFGLEKYSDSIFKTSSGRYYVPNPQMRQEILSLRHDPEISAVMAGMFTQQNAETIASNIGREPTGGELYIGHFLGAQGGSRMIEMATSRPNERADIHFPSAARANRSIFYSKGRPRSLGEVYRVLVSKHNDKQVASPSLAELPQRNPVAADELKAVSSTPQKVPPLPHRKLALGKAPGGNEALGSVGQWVTIVQSADQPVPSQGMMVQTKVAGWLERAEGASRSPGQVSISAPVPTPKASPEAVERSSEKPIEKLGAGEGGRTRRARATARPEPEHRAIRTPRHQPRAARTRDDIVFENFFNHMALNG